MFRRLKEWQVDLFAVPITLNHEGRQKANSRHGIFLTVLFVGFIVWSVYSLSHELFVKKNPNTITYDSFVDTPIPMELNKNSFPFAFGLQLPIMQGLNFFKDEQIYKPDVKLVVFNIEKASDGTVNKTRDLIDIDVEACRLEHFGDASGGFTDLPLDMLYCIKPTQSNLDKIIIKGITDYTDSQVFNLAIVKCQNTTDFACKSDDEVEEKLTGAWLSIFYTQTAINPQNFSHPNQRFRTTFVSMVSPNLYKSAITKLNHLNVVSDDGWLFETNKVQNYVKMNTPAEYLDLTPSEYGFLWNGAFEISQVVTTYERKYTKLQTVLAQIQGSAATVILILVVVLQPYSQVKFNETLINELFDVKMKKRDGKEKKKGKSSKKNKKRGEENSKIQKQNTRAQVKEKTPPISHGVDIKFANNVVEKKNTERFMSERALLSTINRYDEERSPKNIMPANKQGTVQSFKTLLFSIENETESPAGRPYYQKPPQTLIEQGKSQEIKAKKFNKEENLAVGSPDKSKLQVFSDIVSEDPSSPNRSSPRKMYEYYSREGNESSFERESPIGQGQKEKKFIEESMTSPMSPQSQINEKQHDIVSMEMIDLNENNDDDKKESPPIRSLKTEEINRGHESQENSVKYESAKIDISLWEFVLSFVKKTDKTKEKFEVLNRGMKNVRERMDILNIMKKFREIDKLKALLLEEDQLVLFNAIPKSEVQASASATMIIADDSRNSKTFSGRILKKSTFIEIDGKQEQVRQSFDNLQLKAKKTKIDYRLLEIYNELLLNKKK